MHSIIFKCFTDFHLSQWCLTLFDFKSVAVDAWYFLFIRHCWCTTVMSVCLYVLCWLTIYFLSLILYTSKKLMFFGLIKINFIRWQVTAEWLYFKHLAYLTFWNFSLCWNTHYAKMDPCLTLLLICIWCLWYTFKYIKKFK